MELIAFSFLVIALAMLGMGVGTLMGRRPIRGSCGGVAGAKEPHECMLCASRRDGEGSTTAVHGGVGCPRRDQAGESPGPDY